MSCAAPMCLRTVILSPPQADEGPPQNVACLDARARLLGPYTMEFLVREPCGWHFNPNHRGRSFVRLRRTQDDSCGISELTN